MLGISGGDNNRMWDDDEDDDDIGDNDDNDGDDYLCLIPFLMEEHRFWRYACQWCCVLWCRAIIEEL